MGKDLRQFIFRFRIGDSPRYKTRCWGIKNCLEYYSSLIRHLDEFELEYDNKIICKSDWLGTDDWTPYRVIFSKGIPAEIYKMFIEAIKSGLVPKQNL